MHRATNATRTIPCSKQQAVALAFGLARLYRCAPLGRSFVRSPKDREKAPNRPIGFRTLQSVVSQGRSGADRPTPRAVPVADPILAWLCQGYNGDGVAARCQPVVLRCSTLCCRATCRSMLQHCAVLQTMVVQACTAAVDRCKLVALSCNV